MRGVPLTVTRRGALAGAAAGVVAVCAPAAAAAAAELSADANPLLSPWRGPFGGTPPFDQVKPEQFASAMDQSIQSELAEVDALVRQAAPPTFANSVVALERSGRAFDRVNSIYNVCSSTMNLGAFNAVQTETEPKLAAFNDRIYQNLELFRRIAAAYSAPEPGLSTEDKRLSWLYYNNFIQAGAKLAPADKVRVAEINQALAGLFSTFNQNLRADEAGHVLFLKSWDLDGLPQSLRDAAAAAAEARGRKGEWAILNTRSSMEPFLTYSKRRDLRESVWRTYFSRGDNNDAHDNKATITKILKLRAERARLLGYPTHAHWRLETAMAKTPDNAVALMEAVWKPAVERVREEVADMQALADREGLGITIEPWDYRFYAEKVRTAKYDVDMDAVKPYLQLDKLREGLFWVAERLHGLTFTRAETIPVIHPDITVYDVGDGAGAHVGYCFFDPFARPGKRSGAWMSEYRPQQKLLGDVTPIVSVNTNFVKGRPDEPMLIRWDDAVGLFREFGHAVHGLSSNVTYSSLAGTAVARDFVEFPSQLNENWLPTPEVLSRFAVHYQSGKPIPADLVAKIQRAKTFNQGFATVEYLAGALVDMKLHLAGDVDIDPDAFERKTLADLGMPREIVMRNRTPQFSQIFSSDEYSAGSYSNIWAAVLDHDAFDAFLEAGGPYDPAVARRYRETVLSVGNSIDPAQAYRNFRGRDPKVGALLRARAFAT